MAGSLFESKNHRPPVGLGMGVQGRVWIKCDGPQGSADTAGAKQRRAGEDLRKRLLDSNEGRCRRHRAVATAARARARRAQDWCQWCVCVRVCVRACMRACVRACV